MPQLSWSPSGFASRCDWVIGSRYSLKTYGMLPGNTSWGDTSKHPETIFVRSDLVADFYHTILPCLSRPFVLITGDHDVTVPRQVDARYPKLISRRDWEGLITHALVLHTFSENLDEAHPRVTGIPTGLNAGEFPNANGDYLLPRIAGPTKLSLRPLKVLDSNRQRTAPQFKGQFEDRARLTRLCQTVWKNVCVHRTIEPGAFFDGMQEYPFVMCVHGGGQDPSPKAWEAMLAGTIPIVQHFPGDQPYRELPVVFVDNWSADVISEIRLRSWLTQLSPYYEDAALRQKVVERLHSKYWWAKVEAVLRGTAGNAQKLGSPFESHTLAIEWRAPERSFRFAR